MNYTKTLQYDFHVTEVIVCSDDHRMMMMMMKMMMLLNSLPEGSSFGSMEMG